LQRKEISAMKYCRFLLADQIHYGSVEEHKGEFWITGPMAAPEEDLAYRLALEKASAESFDFEPMPMSAANLLAPVTPSKIICVGRNYRDHVMEMGNEIPLDPLIFFKPPSSLLNPGGAVRLPAASTRVDFEGELVLVIGKRAHKLKPDADLRGVIRGYTLADDVSARDLQKMDVQFTRAKGFDTFCPMGPLVSDEVDPLAGVTIETRVNGELCQQGSTADFIFSIPTLLCFISEVFTLEQGDVILTGTPSGVGPLKPGDQVEVSIPGLGILAHSVEADTD
jgi:2-keto-4-pentenoate hydratase/2-oxohepta-3-ene-1,7-dioic acid hydratase in catechol pathway